MSLVGNTCRHDMRAKLRRCVCNHTYRPTMRGLFRVGRLTSRGARAVAGLFGHKNHMPRFFFNVLNDIRADDATGVVLPDLKAAHGEALKDIQDIVHDHFSTLRSAWSAWSIEICDEDKNVLLVVPFTSN